MPVKPWHGIGLNKRFPSTLTERPSLEVGAIWIAADETPMFALLLTCVLLTALGNLEGKVVPIADENRITVLATNRQTPSMNPLVSHL